jgi:3-hydroxyacyl-CoA dehydrogenase
MKPIRRAAVIGSGVMGRGIAAHLASCGIPSLLLDLDVGMVKQALKELPQSKPGLLYDNTDLGLITPGSIDKDLEAVKDCDWVVEVIIEQLEPKQQLYATLEALLQPGQIISSNTSGISWSLLTAGRSKAFQSQFCITHFFNPVRYLKLVEVVGGEGTDPAVLKHMSTFLSETLGKGVVPAKDTPNFIANRIGVHGVMVALHHLAKTEECPGVIDRVMGAAIGRPKSAIFRTADIVGLDTLAHVARNSYALCPEDEAREIYRLPAFYESLLEHKALGQKTGKGFYAKSKDDAGNRTILAFNVTSGEYGPQRKLKTPSLGAVREMDDPAEKMRTVVFADDEAGAIAWPLVSESLVYAANRVPEIADTINAVDQAMMWGFGWELGPFATWDALGVAAVVERLESEGRDVPQFARAVLDAGEGSFYLTRGGVRHFFDGEAYRPVPTTPGILLLKDHKSTETVVKTNSSGSLIDIGDGIFCCEFHSKMNAIDEETITIVNESIAYVEAHGQGLVIGNEGANFCVGANLMLIFLEAQQKNWEKIDVIVQQFQGLCQRLRFAKKPIVAAPFHLALGGGCEIVLGAAKVQAAAETYIGLVELGVGLVPAGAGCKNMLLRTESLATRARSDRDQIWMSPKDGGPFPKVRMAFEAIGYAKVATSAKEAQRVGYLRRSDAYTMDRDLLLRDAKASALALAQDYQPPVSRDDISLPGKGGYYALVNAMRQAKAQGFISDYDEFLGQKLAHILTGSEHPSAHNASEQEILDREREVFLSLCGEEKTHDRIQHMLLKGKPLRN